jgi:hypothetical protein
MTVAPRRLVLISGIAVCALVIVSAALLTLAAGGSLPAASSASSAVLSGAAPGPSAGVAVVWGKVPTCACLDGPGTTAIVAQLEQANLPADVQAHSTTGGWLYFAVKHDPNVVASGGIEAAIVASGGQVIAGPP